MRYRRIPFPSVSGLPTRSPSATFDQNQRLRENQTYRHRQRLLSLWILASPTFLHNPPVERLKRERIVRIKFGEGIHLLEAERFIGVFKTNHLTPSVQGGAVSDPVCMK